MESKFKVVYGGRLREGVDPEQFVKAFVQMFKVSEQQARKLVNLGHDLSLKNDIDRQTAEKYREVTTKLGMEVRIEPMVSAPAVFTTVDENEPEPVEPAAAAVRCPKCGSDRVQGDDCLACGIIIPRYLEAQERLAQQAADMAAAGDETATGDGMTGPHSVGAGSGWQWIVGGWNYFRRNPFAWLGALLLFVVVAIVVSLVPLVGGLAVSLFSPVITAGFMIGADHQRQGGDFEVGHVFAGFSSNTGSLVLVGLLYLLGTAILSLIGVFIIGGSLVGAAGDLHALEQNPAAAQVQMHAALSGPVLIGMLVILALMIPLLMAYWFAPALVAFEGMGPVAAMKTSFVACLKNIVPFLVYGIVGFALAFIAAIPFGLGFIILMPVMIAAQYASYRDIFYEGS